MALDHFYGKSIQTVSNGENHPNHRWIISNFKYVDEQRFMKSGLPENLRCIIENAKTTNLLAQNDTGTGVSTALADDLASEIYTKCIWFIKPKVENAYAIVNASSCNTLEYGRSQHVKATNGDEDSPAHLWYLTRHESGGIWPGQPKTTMESGIASISLL